MKVNQESFDAAIDVIIGKEFSSFLKGRTTKANAAIAKIFMDEMETDKRINSKSAVALSIKIIREAMKRLEKEGSFVWDNED